MVHLKKESKVITDGAEGRNKCRAETEKSRNDGQKGLSGGGHWKWGEDGNWLHFLGLQNHCGQWCSHEIKTPAPWKKSYDKPKQHIKKQRHHFANKGPYSQSYGFSSSHVWMWELDYKECCSIQFSHSVVSDSLQPQGLQHTRPPCPSSTPGAYSNSCPLSQWCHPTISSSVIPFSSCLQSFPAPGSSPMSQFFASGGQSTGVSASTLVLPMNTQDWSPLGWTG